MEFSQANIGQANMAAQVWQNAYAANITQQSGLNQNCDLSNQRALAQAFRDAFARQKDILNQSIYGDKAKSAAPAAPPSAAPAPIPKRIDEMTLADLRRGCAACWNMFRID